MDHDEAQPTLDSQAAAAHDPAMDPATPRTLSGRLIFDLYIEEGGGLSPEIKVSPVGRLTPAAVDRYLPYIYRAIQLAQVEARQADLTPAPTPRNRKAA